ncbi:MAG: hypothetical protein NW215_10740 [Hyphomicrobiales bacterium]|nr:hypothetical protein [Hyphomicrobiales bacterium]
MARFSKHGEAGKGGYSLYSGRREFVDSGFAPIIIRIDASDAEALGRRLAAFELKRQDRIMTIALNKGMDRVYTVVKHKLVEWSGIRVKRRAYEAMRKKPAHAGNWASAVIVADRHTRVTKAYYGATWKRSMPGVKHSAWRRPQTAKGAFMIPGKEPAFKRAGPSRFPILPVWGPSMPREVERHRDEVQALASSTASATVAPEAIRLMGVALAKLGKGGRGK